MIYWNQTEVAVKVSDRETASQSEGRSNNNNIGNVYWSIEGRGWIQFLTFLYDLLGAVEIVQENTSPARLH